MKKVKPPLLEIKLNKMMQLNEVRPAVVTEEERGDIDALEHQLKEESKREHKTIAAPITDNDILQKMIDNNQRLKIELQLIFDQMDT